MSVSVAPPIRHLDGRSRAPLARIAVPAAIAAAFCWAGPAAAAGTAHTSLSVGATVVSSCTISTQPQSANTGPVAHNCSNLGQGSISIVREPVGSGLPAFPERPAASSKVGDATPQVDVRYVTITY